MVSSVPIDAINAPTAALCGLFDRTASLDRFPAKVTAHFSALFPVLDEIPVLSTTHSDRALVRFRAMIQDTSPGPQMYLARTADQSLSGWGLPVTADVNHLDLRECTVLWAVSVPGESHWCSLALDGPSSTATPSYPHKFPIPHTPHHGVQVKIYDTAQSYTSTELHTFVGILTSEPLHADLDLPAPAHVPTLHVLFSQPVPSTIIPRPHLPLPAIRHQLIDWIADQALAGDRHAAEWALLCAIARVQSRNPPILPLSLTLSRFPSPPPHSTTPTLSHVLSLLFPLLTTIPLSLDKLNSTTFAPESKNEDLHSGCLQLPSGTVCLVTESGVTEGTVSERGLANLSALQDLINTQTLDYIFPYSRFQFNTDIAFLVLSQGTKSAFFQTNVNVPLHPSSAPHLYKPADAVLCPSHEKLEIFRHWVGSAKVGKVTVGEQTAQFIQEDFVRERQAAPEAFSSNDLIHLMMLARLLALSLQAAEITIPIWEMAKALEAGRKARIAQQ